MTKQLVLVQINFHSSFCYKSPQLLSNQPNSTKRQQNQLVYFDISSNKHAPKHQEQEWDEVFINKAAFRDYMWQPF